VPERYVLDTSAIFALTDYEAGWQRVEELLDRAQAGELEVGACSLSLMELYYVALQEVGEDSAARLVAIVKSWPLTWHFPDEADLLSGGRLKAIYRLSFADALIAAVARSHGTTLVHKDPELEEISGEVELEALPFKGAG
jgi:predicted nucleic acid-binding protein